MLKKILTVLAVVTTIIGATWVSDTSALSAVDFESHCKAAGKTFSKTGTAYYCNGANEAFCSQFGGTLQGTLCKLDVGEASSGGSCGGVNTSIINCEDSDDGKGGGIFGILLIVLNVLTFGIGIAGTLGIVIAGVMYLTARDSEAQLVKAKNMLLNVVIGLVAYALLWAFLQWIIPGGVFGGA